MAGVGTSKSTKTTRAKRPYKQTADPNHRVGTSLLPLAITSVLFWVPVTIFAKLAVEVREAEPIALDLQWLNLINSHASSFWDTLAVIVTTMGGTPFVVFATLAFALLIWFSHHKRDGLTLLAGVGGVGAINVILKLVFQRARPALWHPLVTEHGYSFPSGHAMGSSALGLCFIVIFWNTRYRYPVAVISSLYIFAVGFSRLYLGVHYPSDVIAGWCISFIWILLVRKIIRAFSTRLNTS
jgi:membrane-associated phospholipid phosphatase